MKKFVFLTISVVAVIIILILKSGSSSTTFVVIGDSQPNDNISTQKVFKSLIGDISLTDAEFVIHLGDKVLGFDKDTNILKDQHRKFINLFNSTHKKNYYVAGNHDIWDENSSNIYEDFYGDLYYSFSYKRNLFIVLNSVNQDNTFFNKQMSWLKDILQKSDNRRYKNIILISHYPVFQRPDLYLHSVDYRENNRDKLVSLIEEYNIKYVFSGHLHLYSKSEHKDITQFISGGGGGALTVSEQKGGFHHFLYVTLKNNKITVNTFRPGEVTKDFLVPYDNKIHEFKISIPKNWEREITSNSLTLSHIQFINPERKSKIVIRSWRKTDHSTNRKQIFILMKEKLDQNIQVRYGYINLNNNVGYTCAFKQDSAFYNYYAFSKGDQMYLIETKEEDNNDFIVEKCMESITIYKDAYPTEYIDSITGYSYALPQNWEFQFLPNERLKKNRLMFTQKSIDLDSNDDVSVAFLDIRKLDDFIQNKEYLNQTIEDFAKRGVFFIPGTISEFKIGDNVGVKTILDVEPQKHNGYKRVISCINNGEKHFRFIIDVYDKKQDAYKLSLLIENGLTIYNDERN